MRSTMAALTGLALASLSPAQTLAGSGIELVRNKNGPALGVPLQVLLMLTVLTVLPAVLVSLTPFLRIVIVLHFLRQALGTQTTPSNQVLIGLSLFLTLLLVQPTAGEIYEKAWKPLDKGEVTASEAWDTAAKPIRTFLLRYTREKDIRLLVEITKAPPPRNAADVDLIVLAPAYILSELKTGFQIGAILFLPFLVIDLVISAMTLAVGMVQLPPALISAPFKILLFVLIDGWNLLIGSLVQSFQT